MCNIHWHEDGTALPPRSLTSAWGVAASLGTWGGTWTYSLGRRFTCWRGPSAGVEVKQLSKSPLGSDLALMGFVFPILGAPE